MDAALGSPALGGSYFSHGWVWRPLPVHTARVSRGTAAEAVYASGTVEALDRVEVKARAAGPLAELLVRTGERVTAGQRLARIDAPTLALDVSRGQLGLSAARERAQAAPQVAALEAQAQVLRVQLAQARGDLERTERLLKSGAGMSLDVERARTQVAALEAQLQGNRAQQQDLRLSLRTTALEKRADVASLRARARDTDVLSPISGVVLRSHAERGEVVSINQNLLRIGDLSHLWLESHVDEADIGRVRLGQPAAVRLNAFADQALSAHVSRILPEADRERKSFEIDLDLDIPKEGLLPGMTAEINIILAQHQGVLIVPAGAIREIGGLHVWVLGASGRLSRRLVTIGIRDLLRVEVTAGLEEGEMVVLDDESLLAEGRRAAAYPAAETEWTHATRDRRAASPPANS